MPIYEYRCTKGHTFEVTQRMVDDPIETCEVCGAPVQRVFHPVAVHFKGSGFYNTDYGKKKKAGATSSDSDASSSSSSNSDKGKSSDSKKESSGSSSSSKSGSDSGSSSSSSSKSGSGSD
jgi:putative FmdB family regulatory protein